MSRNPRNSTKNPRSQQTTYDSDYGASGVQQSSMGPHYGREQMQSQVQRQRSLEASKQMVFEVYQNVISQLEEMESRDKVSKLMPRSNIRTLDQSHKSDADVVRVLEAQLLMFETQLRQCPPRVREEVSSQLSTKTMGWIAQRGQLNLPKGKVEDFANQLLQIIFSGKCDHPDEFQTMPKMSQRDMQDVMQGIVYGDRKKNDLDRSFRENPNKKATLADIRSGGSVSKGADRVLEHHPDYMKDCRGKHY